MRPGHGAGRAMGPFATWWTVVCPHRAAVGGCATGCSLVLGAAALLVRHSWAALLREFERMSARHGACMSNRN